MECSRDGSAAVESRRPGSTFTRGGPWSVHEQLSAILSAVEAPPNSNLVLSLMRGGDSFVMALGKGLAMAVHAMSRPLRARAISQAGCTAQISSAKFIPHTIDRCLDF